MDTNNEDIDEMKRGLGIVSDTFKANTVDVDLSNSSGADSVHIVGQYNQPSSYVERTLKDKNAMLRILAEDEIDGLKSFMGVYPYELSPELEAIKDKTFEELDGDELEILFEAVMRLLPEVTISESVTLRCANMDVGLLGPDDYLTAVYSAPSNVVGEVITSVYQFSAENMTVMEILQRVMVDVSNRIVSKQVTEFAQP
jgi:hypothetical protein